MGAQTPTGERNALTNVGLGPSLTAGASSFNTLISVAKALTNLARLAKIRAMQSPPIRFIRRVPRAIE